jgi:Protein of unknown function (DUF1552)
MYTLTRRAFLRTFAGTSVAASMLRSFEAWAENGVFPRRLLIVYSSAGRDTESYCSGTGRNYALSKGYEPLQAWKNKLLMLDGLSIPPHVSEEHPNGRCSMLTARAALPGSGVSSSAAGASIDRVVANGIAQGKSVYCGPLSTSPNNGSVDTAVSWLGPRAPNESFLEGKNAMLAALFPGGSAPPTPPPGKADAAAQNEHALNRHLKSELERLRKVAPKASVAKLDLHFQALEQLGRSLPPVDGSGPAVPLANCDAAIPGVLTDQDAVGLLLARAFACGRAQVAVMRLGGDEPIHSYSHWSDGPNFRESLRALDRSNAEAFGRLLGYLDSFPEGAGTVLSNTLVVWTSEVSGGYSTGEIHGTTEMPFVLAGGLGGKIKVGERLIVKGKTCADLYRSVAEAMGVAASSSFGDPGFGGSGLPDILT